MSKKYHGLSRHHPLLIGLLLSVGCTVGCSTSKTNHSLIVSEHAIPQVYAGDSLRISLKILEPILLKSSKVEVSMQLAVGDSLTSEDTISAKTECKSAIQGQDVSLEFPTTENFRSGIWYINELRFYLPQQKQWKTRVAGNDFPGFAYRLVNSYHPPEKPSAVEIFNVEAPQSN